LLFGVDDALSGGTGRRYGGVVLPRGRPGCGLRWPARSARGSAARPARVTPCRDAERPCWQFRTPVV